MTASDDFKTKVTFVLPALTAGGAERVLITLMNNIERTRFHPEFVTVSDAGTLRDIIDPSIPFHSLGQGGVLRALPSLYKKLKQLQPDIVVSTMAHMNLLLLLLKPFFPKTKFIVREAITPSFILDGHRFWAPLLRMAYRTLYPKAFRVISPAEIIIDEFRDVLGMRCTNHALLYNPVDLKRIRAEEHTENGITETRKKTVHFVSAGRLHHQKGFDMLLDALPRLDIPYEWCWTILGEGSEREALEDLIAKKGLGKHVSLPGLNSHPWPHYAMADCFLMPSRWEGLPNVVLESLACGTPVIATKESGGISEIAALASGNVRVVDDMDEFLTAMKTVTPAPVEKFRTSLLPDEFDRQRVITRFEAILDGQI